MNKVLLPLLLLLATIGFGGNFILTENAKVAASAGVISKKTAELQSLKAQNQQARAKLSADYDELARARDFISDWESAHARSLRGGLEGVISEAATGAEVTIPTPKVDAPKSIAEVDDQKIEARRTVVDADGKVVGLLRFLAELERTIPASIISSVTIRAGEREPKLNLDMLVMHQSFAPMPTLPEGLPAASTEGLLGKRPDTRRISVPSLADNLVARGTTRASNASSTNTTELSNLLPSLKVFGVVWNTNPARRALLANGYVIRTGRTVPQTLVKGVSRVTVVEIGRDFARFEVATDEVNPLSQRKETTTVIRQLHFQVFHADQPEG